MKDIGVTWAQEVGRKLSLINAQGINLSQEEIEKKTGIDQGLISRIFGRQYKGSETHFYKIGRAIGMTDIEIDNLIYSTMYESIGKENPKYGMTFALKTQFGLTEEGLKDVMRFIDRVHRSESNEK